MDADETKIYLAVIITALVLGVIIIYFAWTIIRQQKRNLALQKSAIFAEISAMEKERTRIAADLHDEMGPILSVIKFQVDYSKETPGNEKEQLCKASEQLDAVIGRMREISNNLMPGALLSKGFITALEEYISKIEATGKIRIRLTRCKELQLAEEKAIHVYRILQEAIQNVIKHSGSDEMEIKVEVTAKYLLIFCLDHGKGFNIEIVKGGRGGIGLNSMKNRAEILGGTMRIDSRTGTGTALLFELPF